MLQLRLTPKAEADLEGIWIYTLETWGRVQAEEYLLSLERTFGQLCANPLLGLSNEDIRPGCRCMQMTSHSIFYRPTRDGLEIIRILHRSMDVESNI
jgi:toxin ParE1/3/4